MRWPMPAPGARDDGHAVGQSLDLDHRGAPRVAGRADGLVTFPASASIGHHGSKRGADDAGRDRQLLLSPPVRRAPRRRGAVRRRAVAARAGAGACATPGRPVRTSSSSRRAICPSRRRSTPRCSPTPARRAGRVLVGPSLAVRAGSTASMAAGHYGAELELRRWIDAAAAPRPRRPADHGGSPASRGDEPAEVLVERLVGPRAARRRLRGGPRRPARPREPRRPARRRTSWHLIECGRPRPVRSACCLDNVNLIRVGDDMAEGTRALAPAHAPRPAQGPSSRRPDSLRRARSARRSARASPTSTASSRSWPTPASTARSASSSHRSVRRTSMSSRWSSAASPGCATTWPPRHGARATPPERR